MNDKRVKLGVIFLTVAIAVVTVLILLNEPVFKDSQEMRYPGVFFNDYSSSGAYKFNPDTILKSLNAETAGEFKEINNISGVHISTLPLSWQQADFLKIAVSAQRQFVSEDNMEGWNLYNIFLDGDCKYIPLGFDIVRISYYKHTGLQEYSASMIGIYPLSGEGEWGSEERFSRSLFRRLNYIDLEKLKVTIEKALQIAEDNGGKLTRNSINNLCRIHLSLSPSPYLEWRVSYSLNINASRIFEIKIDAYDGKYEILYQ